MKRTSNPSRSFAFQASIASRNTCSTACSSALTSCVAAAVAAGVESALVVVIVATCDEPRRPGEQQSCRGKPQPPSSPHSSRQLSMPP